jgi:transcriptional regulator GlxA family with amidase domain
VNDQVVMKPSESQKSVLLVIPESGLLFEAVGIAEIFDQANRCLTEAYRRPIYKVTLATTAEEKIVRGRSGLRLVADTTLSQLDPTEPWDSIVVSGGGKGGRERGEIASWLRSAAPHCKRIVSACAGAFLLAEAGLLDGKSATTHWRVTKDLARRFPQVQVEPDPVYIKDGAVWTSAGASAGFDLALAIVEEDCGAKLAKEVAEYILLFLRRPGRQAQVSEFLRQQTSEIRPILEIQSWILEHLADNLSVEALAERAAMSPRNFTRVFTKEIGISPARYVETIRFEIAKQRLDQGMETIDQVAGACGFGTALTMRRVFERCLGIGPAQYRALQVCNRGL